MTYDTEKQIQAKRHTNIVHPGGREIKTHFLEQSYRPLAETKIQDLPINKMLDFYAHTQYSQAYEYTATNGATPQLYPHIYTCCITFKLKIKLIFGKAML